MVEYGFYHLTRTPLEPALGRLLERVLASGQRAVVVASSPERVEALNRALWTFGRESFLPHGTPGGRLRRGSARVPDRSRPTSRTAPRCWSWSTAPKLEPPPQFTRCLYMFDGNDEAAVAQARALWRRLRARGEALTYWQQTERGWQKAMATTDPP